MIMTKMCPYASGFPRVGTRQVWWLHCRIC